MPDHDAHPIVRNGEMSRFELLEAPGQAHLNYHLTGQRLTLVHTEVADELAGRGIASELLRTALEFGEHQGLEIVPVCPFTSGWLERHPTRAAALDLGSP